MGGLESSSHVVGSEVFSIAVAWGLLFLGVGGPLLLECYRHFSDGHVLFGCAFGATALLVGGLCLWRIGVALHDVRDGARSVSPAAGDQPLD